MPDVDEDQDGLIDGTTLAETTLTIWFFDGADWVQLLDTEVLPDDNVWTWPHEMGHIWEALSPHPSYGF